MGLVSSCFRSDPPRGQEQVLNVEDTVPQRPRPPPIIPPAVGIAQNQGNQATPTDTTVTGSPKVGRPKIGAQQPEVTQLIKQQAQSLIQPNANREDDVDISSEIAPLAPGAPFSWQKGRQIGQGAFGTVYLALVHATGQEIAVKQVSLPRDAANNGRVFGHIRSLEVEVGLLRRLRHENIVRYLGTERTDDCLNIFLEYVPGGPISNKLSQFGPLREETIRVYTKQILRGLEYLHQQKVMHRDIKGANILVDTNGVVKLADFGASRQIEELATIGGGSRSIRGTANWMAPEVIKQSGHGRAADIWSLGCVVIEMATGRAPWSNFSDPYAVMYHVASTKELPAMPDTLSAHAKDFLTLCFNRVPRERPNATRLLQHPWLQNVVIPRATGPPPTLLPVSPSPQARPVQPLQQLQSPCVPTVGPQPSPKVMVTLPAAAPLLPPPGMRSPPSPINEKSESQFGSPAAGVTTASSTTPTSTRAPVVSTTAGAVGVALPQLMSPPQTVPRPAVPPLPLDAMKLGLITQQQQQQQPQPPQATGPGLFPNPGQPPQSAPTNVPPKPPLPPAAAQQSSRGTSCQNQHDTLVDSGAVQLLLQNIRQQQVQMQPGQLQDMYDSICMGVGMTISVGADAAGAMAGAMAGTVAGTMRDVNPMIEPSWMPEQILKQKAFFDQMKKMGTPPATPPESPSASTEAAAATNKVTGSGVGSAPCSSSAGPEAPSATCVVENTKPPPAFAGEVVPAHVTPLPQTSPRSGPGTHRSGAGTWRSGAGTQRNVTRAMPLRSRPPLAGLFAAAYEQENADTHMEPDQPLSARQESPRVVHPRQPAMKPTPTQPPRVVSASRRALEEAGILRNATLDSARAKQWRDELVAELEAERMRAGVGTSMAAVAVGPVPGGRPSVADL
ncbi:hypothetical protein VOLCADRAFT_104524 [Volvox carteri f. nagariensis]|uniref:Protein kinase domain-containing protein n=1 Tax=Volvox carteri f. nagariensis TaxID=3068 RepID=D8TU73_VOLCA|nr:uncharacterized protein VOLCADRAFT_104524 [Volvox carteri f. nagariensis]EFJ48986.1 hypothetical protein VOLCADRAFT_104524 [Volvox carteri f. nagariensis]|eukprot:XP_002949883.1 hypothetical protein VOLCADRAFT_104524 [Volvox carteri f. nagariensis]